MDVNDAPLIVGPLPATFEGPLRAGRWADVLPRVGGWPWPEAVLAACHALVSRVPRVVLARPEEALLLTSPLVLELAPLARDVARRPEVIRPGEPPTDPASIETGVTLVPGTMRFVPPGRVAPVTLPAAVAAFVARARAIAQRPEPLPAEPLAAALEALVRDHAFRLRGSAGSATPDDWASLQREAERILQAEVRAGRVVAYVVTVGPGEDDAEPVVIEARIRLPRRVREVVIRVGHLGAGASGSSGSGGTS